VSRGRLDYASSMPKLAEWMLAYAKDHPEVELPEPDDGDPLDKL